MFLKIEHPDKKYDGRVTILELPQGHVEYIRLVVGIGEISSTDRMHINDVLAQSEFENRLVYLTDGLPLQPKKDGVMNINGTGIPSIYTNWDVYLMNDNGKYIERIF